MIRSHVEMNDAHINKCKNKSFAPINILNPVITSFYLHDNGCETGINTLNLMKITANFQSQSEYLKRRMTTNQQYFVYQIDVASFYFFGIENRFLQ